MYGADDILKAGLRNGEPPEETLAKLFELKDWDDSTGKAFVGVCYAAKNSGNGLYGANVVAKEALEQYDYRVTRTHTGFLHVEILDYVDEHWPKRGGKLELFRGHVRKDKPAETEVTD